jgi:mono/diheme cytochrome c family protein
VSWPALLRRAGAIAAALTYLIAHPFPAAAFPWSIDMFRGDAVQPMEQAPRVMPSGTLPIDGERPRSTAASRRLHNPIDPAPSDIQQGAKLYSTYCSVCHGSGGRGDGPVKFMLRTPAADLTSRRVILMKDGSIYGTIRNGTQIMPSYGDALSPLERWRIVLFIRSLQQKSTANTIASVPDATLARSKPAAPSGHP